LVAAAKSFGCSNAKFFVVPNFVAVTKPFFFRVNWELLLYLGYSFKINPLSASILLISSKYFPEVIPCISKATTPSAFHPYPANSSYSA